MESVRSKVSTRSHIRLNNTKYQDGAQPKMVKDGGLFRVVREREIEVFSNKVDSPILKVTLPITFNPNEDRKKMNEFLCLCTKRFKMS